MIKSYACKVVFLKTAFWLVGLFFVMPLLLNGLCAPAEATDSSLAQQYAPILYFEREETCYPVDVSYHIDNSYLYQFTQDQAVLITDTVTAEALGSYSTEGYQSYYLDNQRGSIDDEGIITDYQNKINTLGYTVYYHIYEEGGSTVIQYWLFYAFNKGSLNIHEGDWETVHVVITNDRPAGVSYSQHMEGQRTAWTQVDRDGDHIKVYVARGSHANYLRPYSGQIGSTADFVGANGKILQPNDYILEELDSKSWLPFSGRWGAYGGIEDEVRGQVGPLGPMYRENGDMWEAPLAWGNSLAQANDAIFLLEWFLYNFIMIFIIMTVISLAFFAFRTYRRHKRHGLGPRIVSLLYIDGLNMKSVGNIVCIIGIVIAIIGLLNQWYGVAVDVNVEGYETEGLVDLIVIDGIQGVQINLLDSSGGLVQLGSFTIPFSLLIGISLVFLILGTVGVSTSRKLSRKYIGKGIRLLIPVILILIVIMALRSITTGIGMNQGADEGVSNILGALSAQPLGGEKTVYLQGTGLESASLDLKWGLGLGGQLLLIAGIVVIIAGVLEFAAHATFFEERLFEKLKKKKSKKKEEPAEEPSAEESDEGKD